MASPTLPNEDMVGLKLRLPWLFLLLLSFFDQKAVFALIEPNRYQIEYISTALDQDLRAIILLWNEEKYDLIYQKYADEASKQAFTQIEFLGRMQKKNYLPKPLTDADKIGNLRFIGMSNVFVQLGLNFFDRAKPNNQQHRILDFKMTYNPISKSWQFDLFVFLRATY